MNADHAFYIGNTHGVCEDYALSGIVDNGAFAIVCDGCSQSPDVDFGASALALSAKRTLSIGGTEMNSDLFGKVTIDNIKNLGETLPLHPNSLDSTLLVSWVKDGVFNINMYGDGVFFHKTQTYLRIIRVDFESNTPAYLSYHLNKNRMKEYVEKVAGDRHIIDSSHYFSNRDGVDNPIEIEDYVEPFKPTAFKGLVYPGDIVGVCSDGVNSFRKSDGSDINWRDIITEFTDFKSSAGVFVQRRLGFIKRQWAKEQKTHYDDISMAAIVV